MIQYIREQYDPTGTGLIGWGIQIGNQEDFVVTPYAGASASIALVEMLRTRAEVADGLGKHDEAEKFRAQAERTVNLLREKLWLPELGRFAFYRDPMGTARPGGAISHAGVAGDLWGSGSAGQLGRVLIICGGGCRGRMRGFIACNIYPNHWAMTSGAQAMAAQQPWGTMGLARVGLSEEAIRPLRWVAQEVTGPKVPGGVAGD